VFNQHKAINMETIIDLEYAVSNTTDPETGERQLYRHNNRVVQPLNGRTVWFHDSGNAQFSGIAGTIVKDSGGAAPAPSAAGKSEDERVRRVEVRERKPRD
jgi:hypothetical protein